MATHYGNNPIQSSPPLDYFRSFCPKTHFLKKLKKQEDSFVNMGQSMNQKSNAPCKVVKKLSLNFNSTFSNSSKFVEFFRKIPREKSVPKSKSTNHIVKSGLQIISRKNTRRVPKSKIQSEIKICEWRATTHFPLVKISFIGSRQFFSLNSQKQVEQELELQINWNEDIKFHLHEIQQFSLLNSLYIISESLVSFERLYNKFGYFEPSLKMVFITNSHKCKIWVNQNIWENYPLLPKFVSKQHQKVECFYKKIINMFGKYFKAKAENHNHENMKRSVNLIEKLIYELERKSDFVQGMKFINEFIQVYSLKIINHFIYPINGSDQRSRIFSKLQKSQLNTQNSKRQIPLKQEIQKNTQILIPKTQQIHPKQQESNNEDEKDIKTLKNSYHQQRSKEVLQSNVKTIINKKIVQKQKQIPLKKKSQMSICSKQTIVQKKSRFSMYDPKQQIQVNKPLNSLHLPNFTNQDFNEEEGSAPPNEQTGLDEEKNVCENVLLIDKEDEYEEQMRNQIQKNVRQKNGWLQNPQLLFDTDQCAKSFQDSQPSVKMKIRQRNLSKLNRIKSSIAHSIVD